MISFAPPKPAAAVPAAHAAKDEQEDAELLPAAPAPEGSKSAPTPATTTAAARTKNTLQLLLLPRISAPAVSETLGLFYVLLSTLCFSVLALCVHFLSERYPSMQIATARYWFSTAFSVLTLLLRRRGRLCQANTWLGEPAHRRLLITRGIWGAGGMSSYFYALSHLQLSDATVLAFLNVPLTGVLGALLLGEAYTYLDGITSVLAMAGVVLIAQPVAIFGGAATSSIEPIAVLVCLFGAMAAALAYITVRQLGPSADTLVVTLYFSSVGAIIAPTLLALFQHPVWAEPDPAFFWSDVGLFSVVGVNGFIGQVLLNRGIQNAPASLAVCMRYSDLVFALIFQSTLIGQPPGWVKLAGCALILSSIVAIVVKRRRAAGAAAAAATVAEAVADGSAAPPVAVAVAAVVNGRGAGGGGGDSWSSSGEAADGVGVGVFEEADASDVDDDGTNGACSGSDKDGTPPLATLDRVGVRSRSSSLVEKERRSSSRGSDAATS